MSAFTPSPAQWADGARVIWQLRYIQAPDWSESGHTNQTLWVINGGMNPDEPPVPWVEVGVTHGYQGQNTYKFYWAHRWWASGWQYDDGLLTKAAVLGRTVTFSIFWNPTASNFTFQISDSAGTVAATFTGIHLKPVSHYHVGAEFTCSDAEVTSTFVSTNKYRKISDGSWVNVTVGNNSGPFHDSGLSGAGTAWCAGNTTFRFWVNEPQAGCS